MTTPTDLNIYGAVACLYAAAHDVHPRTVDHDDAGCQEMSAVLGMRDALDIAELSKLLGLPPDEERDGEQIAETIGALRASVQRVRDYCAEAMKLPTIEDPRPASDFISPRAVVRLLDGIPL